MWKTNYLNKILWTGKFWLFSQQDTVHRKILSRKFHLSKQNAWFVYRETLTPILFLSFSPSLTVNIFKMGPIENCRLLLFRHKCIWRKNLTQLWLVENNTEQKNPSVYSVSLLLKKITLKISHNCHQVGWLNICHWAVIDKT